MSGVRNQSSSVWELSSFYLVTIGIINVKLRETETNGEFWLAKVPFGIYFGWVTAATILNATIALVYLGVRLPDSTSNLIGAGLILIAAALGAFVRWKLKNYFYPLAIAWAITAIAVKQSGHTDRRRRGGNRRNRLPDRRRQFCNGYEINRNLKSERNEQRKNLHLSLRRNRRRTNRTNKTRRRFGRRNRDSF